MDSPRFQEKHTSINWLIMYIHYVTPRSCGCENVTTTYIRRSKYPHIYMLSISTGKNQSTKALDALYITTYEQLQSYHRMCHNITRILHINDRRKCKNIKSYTIMNCTKCAHESQWKTQEPCRGSGRIVPQMVCRWFTLSLHISDQQPGEFTNFKLWDLDM